MGQNELNKNGGNRGFEAELFTAADKLRGNMEPGDFKHVALGLIFRKYISDTFEERYGALLAEKAQGADPEDFDEYRAHSIFWAPPETRWAHPKAQARQPTIGQLVDDTMAGIERDNPVLKGVLPKDYPRPALDKVRCGQLIDMISNIRVGDEASRAKDVLGRVRDPCCGSSGRFVPSVAFIRAHASGNDGNRPDISTYNQESLYTTRHLAKMNLSIRGLEGDAHQGGNVESVAWP